MGMICSAIDGYIVSMESTQSLRMTAEGLDLLITPDHSKTEVCRMIIFFPFSVNTHYKFKMLTITHVDFNYLNCIVLGFVGISVAQSAEQDQTARRYSLILLYTLRNRNLWLHIAEKGKVYYKQMYTETNF